MIVCVVDYIFCLFLFEFEIYVKVGILVMYVGYLLVDEIFLVLDVEGVCMCLGLLLGCKVVVVLLGSCNFEVKYFGLMLFVVMLCMQVVELDLVFVLLVVNVMLCECIDVMCVEYLGLYLWVVDGQLYVVMEVVDVILFVSGMVMLEVVLYKKLMVIIYKVFWLMVQIMKCKGYLLYVGLLNILFGCFVVLELL